MISSIYYRSNSTFKAFSYYIPLLCFFLFTNTVNGTSVLGVTLEQMANNCEFVFEGRVLSVEARMTQNGSNIHTFVEFDIIESIKGEYHNDQIELRFAGGTVDGLTRRVGDMHIPEVGETGLYFVESLSRTHVHPFYGWSQGHLLIIKDAAGIERVTTQRKQAVMAIEPAIRRSPPQPQLSTGAAQGLVVEEGRESYDGMSKSQFKRKLRDMLRPP